MKYLFLLLFTTSVYAQEVYEVEGTSKELKTKSLSWAADHFNDLSEAMVSETDEFIMLKGNFDENYGIGVVTVWFTLRIEFKDGRYRYQIYDKYILQKDGRSFNFEKGSKKFQEKANNRIYSLEESLKAHMSKKEDNW